MDDTPEITKQCKRCAKILPMKEFYVCKNNKDGLCNMCTKCKIGKTFEERMQAMLQKEQNTLEKYKLFSESTKSCYRCLEDRPITDYEIIKGKLKVTCKECSKKPMTDEQYSRYSYDRDERYKEMMGI